jgi:hypothetical protein
MTLTLDDPLEFPYLTGMIVVWMTVQDRSWEVLRRYDGRLFRRLCVWLGLPFVERWSVFEQMGCRMLLVESLEWEMACVQRGGGLVAESRLVKRSNAASHRLNVS